MGRRKVMEIVAVMRGADQYLCNRQLKTVDIYISTIITQHIHHRLEVISQHVLLLLSFVET